MLSLGCRLRPYLIVIALLLLAGAVRAARASQDRPLPDQATFLQQVRKNLQTDEHLQRGYAYRSEERVVQLDKNGGVKKTEARGYEIYPPGEGVPGYRRLVSRDGVPVSAQELDKADRKQREKVLKAVADRDHESPSSRADRVRKEADQRRDEQQLMDEVFHVFDFRLVRREDVAGRPAIVVAFSPRPGVKARSRRSSIAMKFAGQAWVDEQDHQVVRVNVQAIDDVTIGWGLLARVYKGAEGTFERRKVNDEAWLPARAEFRAGGRIALFKRFSVDVTDQFSDYKKFSVDTTSSFTLPKR